MFEKKVQQELLDNISKFSNEKLCEIVSAARYFGSMQAEGIVCMEELARRRADGDKFDYEGYIENLSRKLPDFNIDLKQKIQMGISFQFLKGIK